MTEDKIALRALMEKGSDATFLREMIGFAAQRRMELETDTLRGAAHGEPSDSRVNYRPPGREVRGHIRRLVRRLRTHWPHTRLTIRGDSHYGRHQAMAW